MTPPENNHDQASGAGWPGSGCIAGAQPLTRAMVVADIILVQMDRAGLRRGKGIRADRLRPTWREMSEWCETALSATSPTTEASPPV